MTYQDRIVDFRRVPASELRAHPKNWRKHPQGQRDALEGVLRDVGWADAVLARPVNGHLELIDGHLRAEVADDDEVPVLVLDVNEEEAAEILATHDPITALAGIDQSKFDDLLHDFNTSDDALQGMLSDLSSFEAASVEEDEVPEPPADPVTKPGDLWLLGEHRLLCGDSTSAEDVGRVMDGNLCAAVLTDPPYGVEYVGKTKDALTIENDGAEDLSRLLRLALGFANDNCLAGGAWYVAAPAGPQFLDFASTLMELEVWRQTIVWVKDSMVLGRSDYHYRHEAIFYGWKPGQAHKAPPDRKQTTVWNFDRPKSSQEHPTMKPVALFAKMLENSTAVGSLIYEPFGGSGTTLIAAEQLDRKCYGLEISPQYCDVIVERWQNLTGGKAVRNG